MASYTNEDGDIIHYMALHSKVLVAYVCNPQMMDYKAYCFPVPGMSHAQEARLWQTEGTGLTEKQAAALWPELTESLLNADYLWRH